MGKYDSYIRESLRDETNALFALANELAERNELKREEIRVLKKINGLDDDE